MVSQTLCVRPEAKCFFIPELSGFVTKSGSKTLSHLLGEFKLVQSVEVDLATVSPVTKRYSCHSDVQPSNLSHKDQA